jgi:hypothetical protein
MSTHIFAGVVIRLLHKLKAEIITETVAIPKDCKKYSDPWEEFLALNSFLATKGIIKRNNQISP